MVDSDTKPSQDYFCATIQGKVIVVAMETIVTRTRHDTSGMSYVQFLCCWLVRPSSSWHRNGYRLSCQAAKIWSPVDQNRNCPNDNFQCNKTGNVRIDVTLQSVRVTTGGNKRSITYSECVSIALGIQHAMRKRYIFICWPAPLHNIFPHYLTNGTIFGKRLLNINCVFWFSL
jgi:hypothetical protein